ncbi:MAG: restriction endonuclease subunit S [Candidatus Moraniibacteriota bacterium]
MKFVKFSQLLDFQKKSHIKAGDGLKNGSFPFFTSSPLLSKYTDSFQFELPSLIFGTGGSASIHICDKPFSVSTDCLVAQLKPDMLQKFEIKFIYYYLSGNVWILERGFKGAGLKHISKGYINDIDIPELPREEQKRIVKILDETDACRQKRKQAIELLNDYLKSVFLEMFGDPVQNPRKWDLKPLEKVAKLERGRFSPRPRNDPSYFNGEHPFIQTGDISNSNHKLNKFVQTLNEKGTKVSKQFFKGDIVIAIVGATIGVTAILEIDVYATDSVICIKPYGAVINNIYLEYVLRFWKKILLRDAPEAARPNINLTILNNLKIILPPVELQTRFVSIVEKVEDLRQDMIVQSEEMEKQFQVLMQKAFKGEL